jgi:ribosome recycling factor
MRIIAIALAVFLLLGCSPEPAPTFPGPPVKSLISLNPENPEKPENPRPAPTPLTEDQRKELTKQLKANQKLLAILKNVEKQIKGKQRKADFFGFALSDDDEITLEASKILLNYFKKTKSDIRAEITNLQEQLKSKSKSK